MRGSSFPGWWLVFALAMAPVSGLGQEHEHEHERPESNRDRDRWMWQQPERVMDVIGVRPSMVVADVGAGEGYFTLPLARRVGPQGKVYAEDIDERGLGRIQGICAKEGLNNVETILGRENDPLLPERAMDLVLMVNTIHFIEKPLDFFRNVSRALKPDGSLVVIQWDSEKMSVEIELSPSDRELYSKDAVLRTMEEASYEVVRVETFLPVQNIYVFRPR